MSSSVPFILLGGGGHGRVCADVLAARGDRLWAVADPAEGLCPVAFAGAVHWRADGDVLAQDPTACALVNGVGAVPGAAARRRRALYEPFTQAGFRFPALVHPSAVIGRGVEVADGAQVMAGAVIQPGCRLGFGVVVNTRASVDHDCRLDAHAMISPGAVVCGGVHVGTGAYLGAGCTVLQGVTIGAGALVPAGAVVRGDIPENGRA